MNIMIINHYAGSPEMGMEYRPYYLAKYWQKQGHKVVVVCASFSHLRQNNPPVQSRCWEEQREGVRYLFLWTPCYHENNGGRVKNILAFVGELWRRSGNLAQKYRPDVVIASSTYPFDSFPAAKIARLSRAKLVYEIHDLWPLSLIQLYHYHNSSPLILAVRAAQRFAVRQADLVVSMIEQGDKYLREQGLCPRQYRHIPNGTDTAAQSRGPIPQKHIDFIEKYRQQGKFIVMYLGGFGRANYLEPLLLAARLLQGKAEVILVGDGMDKPRVKRIASHLKIQNVHFLPSVPKTSVGHLLEQGDCLYIGTVPSPLYSYGVAMNKLFDYMLAQKPVLFSTPAKNNPVAKAGCGITVAAGNPAFIAEGLRTISQMSESQRETMGKQGAEYCRAFHSYEAISQEFLRAMEQAGTERKMPC